MKKTRTFTKSQNREKRFVKLIDWSIFEKLCALQCTREEMAGFFKIDVDTLTDRVVYEYKEPYTVVYQKYAQDGIISLRRAQMRTAVEKNNPTMQIWLGQQYLRQTQKAQVIGLSHEELDKRHTEYDVREKLYAQPDKQEIS